MESMLTALTTAISTIGNNAISAIGSVLPTALTIVGAVMVVTIGVKVFKKISNK